MLSTARQRPHRLQACITQPLRRVYAHHQLCQSYIAASGEVQLRIRHFAAQAQPLLHRQRQCTVHAGTIRCRRCNRRRAYVHSLHQSIGIHRNNLCIIRFPRYVGNRCVAWRNRRRQLHGIAHLHHIGIRQYSNAGHALLDRYRALRKRLRVSARRNPNDRRTRRHANHTAVAVYIGNVGSAGAPAYIFVCRIYRQHLSRQLEGLILSIRIQHE